MKSVKFIITILVAVSLGTNIFSQTGNPLQKTTVITENFKVLGNCDLCKARIEKAAKIDGVSKAEWNKETRILTLVYNPAVVSGMDVQRKIGAAGHDTEKIKASAAAYNNLPGCCQYDRKK